MRCSWGLLPDIIPTGVAVLLYADDTVLCINHDPEKAINLKLFFLFLRIDVWVKNKF